MDVLHIENEVNQVNSVELIDVSGRVTTLESNGGRIDVSKISSGYYTLKIGDSYTTGLIKK